MQNFYTGMTNYTNVPKANERQKHVSYHIFYHKYFPQQEILRATNFKRSYNNNTIFFT